MKHVLVLDSDQGISTSLAEFFNQHAIRTTPVAESRHLRRILSNEIVDALLIEVDTKEGIEVVRDMASITVAPIVIVSGKRTGEDHKVEGLEAGASDYLCRPFGRRELLARLRVAMRDRPIVERDRRSYSFSDNELLVQHKKLRRAGLADVQLTTAEFNLLTAFLGAPRQILSRERLLAASRMHSGEIFDRSLDALILRLRRKIEMDPAAPNLIKTVRGSGYLFDSDVTYDDRPRLKR